MSDIKNIEVSGIQKLLTNLTHLEDLTLLLASTDLKDTKMFEGLRLLKNIKKLVVDYK
jgi:hypothetical protein